MNFNCCNAKGVIFDIDGTLIDSMIVWDKISEDFVREQGKEPELGLNKIVYTMTVDEGCRYMQEHYYPEKSVQEIKDGLIKKLADFYFNEVQLKPGAKKLIETLAKNNIPMVLATTGDTKLSKGALERLGVLKYFKAILSCNDLNTTKGEPDIFYKAIEILSNSKIDSAQVHKFTKDFVVVEDSLKAIKTTAKAGFQTIAVKDNAAKSSWAELKTEADYFLDSLEEITFDKIN